MWRNIERISFDNISARKLARKRINLRIVGNRHAEKNLTIFISIKRNIRECDATTNFGMKYSFARLSLKIENLIFFIDIFLIFRRKMRQKISIRTGAMLKICSSKIFLRFTKFDSQNAIFRINSNRMVWEKSRGFVIFSQKIFTQKILIFLIRCGILRKCVLRKIIHFLNCITFLKFLQNFYFPCFSKSFFTSFGKSMRAVFIRL